MQPLIHYKHILLALVKKPPHIAQNVLEFDREWRRKNSFSGFNKSRHSQVITVAPPAAAMSGDKYSLILAKQRFKSNIAFVVHLLLIKLLLTLTIIPVYFFVHHSVFCLVFAGFR